ncbi:MAG: GGDEF domain-containing protein [Clostridium sp.]|nr:GGDEF domain-containing protein [Clostridium sp.]
MKKFFTYAKNVLNGTEQITNRLKFSLIVYSIACVHVVLLCVFLVLQITPLYLFNLASVATYLFAARWVRREIYLPVYYTAYFEIILHSFVATLCIGWQFGFAQYIIAVIPVGYYVSYTLHIKRHRILIPTQNAVAASILFLTCKFLSYYLTPFYTIDNPVLEFSLYTFNSICTFLFLIVFSLIYVVEIRSTYAKLRHQNMILEQLANTDPLTGLYNRRSMQLFIEQALASDSSFALIMGDIDDFKKINDTYGHDFGDVALHDIAQIAVAQVGEQGYVCRWGGEELLILISNGRYEQTYQIAESIRRHVANHIFETNNKWIHCTLTLGIATYQKGMSVEETITQADSNLYRGKRSGKNKVVM